MRAGDLVAVTMHRSWSV